MKKIISVMLIISMLSISLVGCSSKKDGEKEDDVEAKIAIVTEDQEENPDGYFPRLRPIQTYGGGPLAQKNDRYLQKVNYLRLKNITFGYTVQFKKAFISSLRIYFAAENIAYASPLKKYCKTIDPELAVASGTYASGTGTGYTMPRTFTFGLNLNF